MKLVGKKKKEKVISILLERVLHKVKIKSNNSKLIYKFLNANTNVKKNIIEISISIYFLFFWFFISFFFFHIISYHKVKNDFFNLLNQKRILQK